jgi:hypothetical protein
MKRKDEIQKLIDEETGIDNYGSSDYQIGVCDGVRLADRTMLDRACKWLKDGGYFVNSNETIEDFRKAMEGGAE